MNSRWQNNRLFFNQSTMHEENWRRVSNVTLLLLVHCSDSVVCTPVNHGPCGSPKKKEVPSAKCWHQRWWKIPISLELLSQKNRDKFNIDKRFLFKCISCAESKRLDKKEMSRTKRRIIVRKGLPKSAFKKPWHFGSLEGSWTIHFWSPKADLPPRQHAVPFPGKKRCSSVFGGFALSFFITWKQSQLAMAF